VDGNIHITGVTSAADTRAAAVRAIRAGCLQRAGG